MILLSWEQSSFIHSLGSSLLFKTLRVCLNNQNVLFNTFLTMAAVTLAFPLAVWSGLSHVFPFIKTDAFEQQYIDVK